MDLAMFTPEGNLKVRHAIDGIGYAVRYALRAIPGDTSDPIDPREVAGKAAAEHLNSEFDVLRRTGHAEVGDTAVREAVLATIDDEWGPWLSEAMYPHRKW